MSWLDRTSSSLPAQKASSSSSSSGTLTLDDTPTAREELQAFGEPGIYRPEAWDDPDVRAKHLANHDYSNDIAEKRRFAKHAYQLNWVWVIFLIVVTVLQGTHWGQFQLEQWAFNIVFGGLTTAVFGFAYLVGKYLFPQGGASRRNGK